MNRLAPGAVALLLAVSAAAQTGREYRSNAIGMRLGPASAGGDGDFVLHVLSAGASEEDLLLEQGREVRRTVRVRDALDGSVTETIHENGSVDVTRVYDAQARLVEEKTAEERRVYRYRDGELETLEVAGPDGQPQYRERYAYTSRGRLREVDRVYADGGRSLSSFLFAEGRLVSERLSAAQRILTARYDRSGRLVSEAERRGDTLDWERKHRYDPVGGRLVETVEEHKDHTVRRAYDPAGRLVEEVRTGTDAYRGAYSYDSEGRQSRLRRVGMLGTQEWLTEYDGEGQVSRESYLARGRLQRVRVHTGEREWHDDLYRDGQPVLRVMYRNDQKTGEERLP